MARNAGLTPYNEQYNEQLFGAFDEEVRDPELVAYEPMPPMPREDYSLPMAREDYSLPVDRYSAPEEPMPLFLSDNAEEPRRRGFGTGRELNRAPVWPRIVKAGIFVTAAAAIATAIASMENPLALFANARASLMASASDQSGTTPKSDLQPAATVQLASSGPPTLVVEAPVSVKAIPPAVKVAPTRDDIALALRSAPETKPQIETQAETVQQPPAAAPPPARRLAADELAALLKRARSLIEVGDIAPARLLLERAAEAQEASAALMLAQTYDPAVLGIQDMRSITPDQAMARDWYQKAARLGSLDAKQRLAQMQN
jgi:hypothetical protein